MSHTLHLLSFNFMLVTSWYLTSWYSLWKSPLIICFSLFCITERKLQCNPQKTMDPTPGTVCHTQVTWFSDASLLTVLKQCRKKEYRILMYLLFVSNLGLWAPTVWSPWFPMEGGGDTVLEAQAYCVLSSARLGIKAIFLFSSKKHLFPQMYKVPIFLFLFALFQNSQ